jgi:deazaflavin-dependent oxidoreductase (nitroreductase family)
LRRLGSRPAVVWLVKNVVSPLDRLVVRISRGRLRPPSSFAVPTLLLTTTGRRSGEPRTVPLVYVRDGERFVVANARPEGERRNPWVLNLRAKARAAVKLGRHEAEVVARELDDAEAEMWWPQLVEEWPAFAEHFAATGERAVFVLEPVTDAPRVDGSAPAEPR